MTLDQVRRACRMMRLGLTNGDICDMTGMTGLELFVAARVPSLANGGSSAQRRCTRRLLKRARTAAALPSAREALALMRQWRWLDAAK